MQETKVANARIGQQLGAQSRSYKLTTPDGKNLTYTPQPYAFEYDSEYNGVPIKKTMVLEVPKELKGSFISIVYNEMVDSAQKLDDERTEKSCKQGKRKNQRTNDKRRLKVSQKVHWSLPLVRWRQLCSLMPLI